MVSNIPFLIVRTTILNLTPYRWPGQPISKIIFKITNKNNLFNNYLTQRNTKHIENSPQLYNMQRYLQLTYFITGQLRSRGHRY